MKKIASVLLSFFLFFSGFSMAFGNEMNDLDTNSLGYIFVVSEAYQMPDDFPFRHLGWNIYKAENIQDIYNLIDSKYIEYIEKDQSMELMECDNEPNDNYYISGKQWNLDMMNVKSAWDYGIYGDGIKVAVLDTGVNGNHVDLKSNRILQGYDFVRESSFSSWNDVYGHGTSVAGIIGASQNNKTGISGIMPESLIAPYKVVNDSGQMTYSDLIDALFYAVTDGIDVINMSLGVTRYSPACELACYMASNAGIILIGSSGNKGSNVDNYPSKYVGVISVGSVDSNGFRSSFSQYGNVDVTAPGNYVTGLSNKGGYQINSLRGTSFSSPEVAALAAMAKAINPEINSYEFLSILKLTSQYDIPTQKEGYGLVDFKNVVQYMLSSMSDLSYSISYDIKNSNGIDYSSITDIKTYKLKSDFVDKVDSVSDAEALSDDSWEEVLEASLTDLSQGFYKYSASSQDGLTAEECFYTYAKERNIKVILTPEEAKINFASLTNLTVEIKDEDPDQTDVVYYDGALKEPDVNVFCDEVSLRKGLDYKLSYQDNLNQGTATLTVIGKGDYSGKFSKEFVISEHNATLTPIVSSSLNYKILHLSGAEYDVLFDSASYTSLDPITIPSGDLIKVLYNSPQQMSDKPLIYKDTDGNTKIIVNDKNFYMPSYNIKLESTNNSPTRNTPTANPGFSGGSGGGGSLSPIAKQETNIKTDTSGNSFVSTDKKEVTIKNSDLDKITNQLTVETKDCELVLDKTTLDAIKEKSSASGKDLELSAVKVKTDSKEVRLEFTATVGGVKISDFNGGTIEVNVDLPVELSGKNLQAVYIGDDGKAEKVDGEVNADGTFTMHLKHFSEYAIMSEEDANKLLPKLTEDEVIKLVSTLKITTRTENQKNGIKIYVNNIKELEKIKDSGYTVLYDFYNIQQKKTPKNSQYVKTKVINKKTGTYLNTSAKKGKTYYYKVIIKVKSDNIEVHTALSQCKYGKRTRS